MRAKSSIALGRAAFLTLATLAGLPFLARADEPPPVAATLQAGVFGKYVWGNGITWWDGVVEQGSATVSAPRIGLYGRAWLSYSHDGGFNQDFGDEADYTVGWNGKVAGGKVGIDASYTFVDFIPIGKVEGDIHQLDLSATLPKLGPIEPSVVLDAYLSTDDALTDGGFSYAVGGTYVHELKGPVRSFAIAANAGGHDRSFGAPGRALSRLRLGVTADVPLGRAVLQPSLNLQKSVGGDEDFSRDHAWAGLNLLVSF